MGHCSGKVPRCPVKRTKKVNFCLLECDQSEILVSSDLFLRFRFLAAFAQPERAALRVVFAPSDAARQKCFLEVLDQGVDLSALTFDGQGEPMRMEALALNLPYNREECYVSIPLGQLLATFEEKDMMVYLVAINVKNSTFTTGSGAVTGVVSDDFRTITLHGLPEEYQTLGLISRKISDTSQVGMFGDIYPSGEGIVLAREAASASSALLPVAFSSVQRGDVVRLRAHTTGRINRIEQFN